MKTANIYLRIDDDAKREFEIVAKLRGSTMSGLIHQFIVRTIREEKIAYPQAFENEELKIKLRPTEKAATTKPNKSRKS